MGEGVVDAEFCAGLYDLALCHLYDRGVDGVFALVLDGGGSCKIGHLFKGFDKFRYGQRHGIEIASAEKVAAALGASEHRIIDIDLAAFGGSALTDPALEVPKNRENITENDIPITYVPARNTIFLSYALAWAEVLGSFDIFIGVNATDYSGYPDCRPEFIKAFEKMANLATAAAVQDKGKYTIHTPIIEMTKGQIIQTGTK
ncbi:MAG TPA: hypothetical protein ENH94_06255, partial [Phycisphaerales bacterium]|nr:hypothetical protein [Phycisphaerales bacterium]